MLKARLSSPVRRLATFGIAFLSLACSVFAYQTDKGTIQGRVSDPSGAVVADATVAVHGPVELKVATGRYGAFEISAPPGRYTVTIDQPGFGHFESEGLDVKAGLTLKQDIVLRLEVQTEVLSVTDESPSLVSTDSSSNAGAVVLNGADLDALPDDPDELASDLRALAGSFVGPAGTQIYVDNFSGGHLPSKDSIREIRINQNPFSAEFDTVGLGRIEVFTKPGADRFHGAVSYKLSDGALNSRNPYSPVRPPYQARQLDGNLGGPLGGRASFSFDFEHRAADDNALLNTTVLSSALRVSPLTSFSLTPQSSWTIAGRVDYQISANHTLAARVQSQNSNQDNAGLGTFSLPALAYSLDTAQNTAQLTETAVLGAIGVNEARFQFSDDQDRRASRSQAPTLNVLDAFSSGGSTYGHSSSDRRAFEFQNYTSLNRADHLFKFGLRLRDVQLDDRSLKDFNGTFVFAGGTGPQLDANNQVILGSDGQPVLISLSSLERYRRTLMFQSQGLTPAQIRVLGGGASQFSLTTGAPLAFVQQAYIHLFAQDEWRVRPGLTLSLGLRWERQSSLQGWGDLAPRVGFAWSPSGQHGAASKTVVRGGSGFFYQPFGEDLTANTVRFNGLEQQRFIVRNPDFFPAVPSLASLSGAKLGAEYRTNPALRAPFLWQSAIGVEQELPFRFVLSASYVYLHGGRLLYSRNLNVPIPEGQAGAGGRPLPGGDIYQYQSAGMLNSHQLIANISRRATKRFTVFGHYAYSSSRSNTDGPGWFPANPYGLQGEYGRTALDVNHQFVAGGLFRAPWGFSVSPFFTARSGAPFDFVTGVDRNRDSIYNDRPSFGAAASVAGVVQTKYGSFSLLPNGLPTIPRNFGQGPGFAALNLRISRSFGFGGNVEERSKQKKATSLALPGVGADESALRGILRDRPAGQRYNLTFALVLRNVLNTTNPGLPVGDLSSPLFGRTNWSASSSGPDVAASGDNRRLWLQVRLTF